MNFIFGIIFCLFYPDIGLAKELWSPGELEKAYSKPKKEILKEKLSSRQFEVTQKDGTEPAFVNEYWNNKEQGIYVDIVSGEPLFSSEDKFDSGTGWPSFTRPLDDSKVVKKSDRSHGMERTEVRSKHADSHLGHVFNDGPAPEGKRYCINSASLRFVPLNKMKDQGYAAYLKYFQKKKTEKTSKSSKYE